MSMFSFDMEDPQASVTDVYDLASSIGKEFECIIDVFGVNSVSNLMPKVIHALEVLESMAIWAERETDELEESKFTIQRLQREKFEKAQRKAEFEQELEQYEVKWRVEMQELVEVISKLQLENRRLENTLESKTEQSSPLLHENHEEEIKLMNKLKATIDKQRDQVRTVKKDLDQKQMDNDAMQEQVQRLAKVNVELRRKNVLNTKYSKNLMEEKADLQAQLHNKETEIAHIRDKLSDVSSGSPSTPVTPPVAATTEESTNPMEGKMIIDLSDPDRPRFTMTELRDVILERNELKLKLLEIEEELTVYKPKEDYYDDDEDEDPPVQGPINKEPYEKLYPNSGKPESGIRRFFTNLFGRSPSHKTLSRDNSRKNSVATSQTDSSPRSSPRPI